MYAIRLIYTKDTKSNAQAHIMPCAAGAQYCALVVRCVSYYTVRGPTTMSFLTQKNV